MAFKNTKLYSILTFTCPRCHKGHLFVNKATYAKGMAAMNKRCPVCGENFNPEPGFYFGAAYVSYGLTIAVLVALYVALAVFDALGLITFAFFDDGFLFLGVGFGLLLLLLPWLYRVSRAIWINIFVKFEKGAEHRR